MAGECEDIAEHSGGGCRGSTRWFSLHGTDLDLVLVNDHESICERLRTTGDFVFYSSQNGCCSRTRLSALAPMGVDYP